MSEQTPFDIDKAHRWFGVQYNNSIFPLLEKKDRTEDETEKMIAMAYASTLHWSSYSQHTMANRARGENMIATTLVYAGRKEAALHHAKRNYDIVMNHKKDMADFDIFYSQMVMARAYALNGDMENAKKFFEECKGSLDEIKNAKDKEISVMDFDSGPWYGLK